MSVTAHQLRVLLAERHDALTADPARQWALLFELRNGTGWSGARRDGTDRYVDAFALNLWPSKKHWRIAYEIKVSRADFLRELDRPEKRQWAVDISNEYWFVCAPGVASKQEVPEGCGLLVCDEGGRKLKRVVAARQREARPLDMAEVAAIARQAVKLQSTRSLCWRYAGQDLTEEQLLELAATRLGAVEEQRIRLEVERRLDQRLEDASATLRQYAQDLAAAGVPPPSWMQTFGKESRYAAWGARHWATANVAPGPGPAAAHTAQRKVQLALRAAEESCTTLRAAEAELARLASATSQSADSDTASDLGSL